MRLALISVAILALFMPSSFLVANDDGFPVLKGKYMGQKTPVTTPEIFAPGIVSSEDRVYANVTFAPDFQEVCWTPNNGDLHRWHGGLIISKFQEGSWTKPSEVRFLDEAYNHRSPFYSYDGKRLYFQGHLRSKQGFDQKERLYFVEKAPEGWSEPQLLDTIFNKFSMHWQFSLDIHGNLYFGGSLRDVENSGGIYYSQYSNGKYQEPRLIFDNNRFGEAVFGPVISPQNDYIIFARIHPRGSTNPRIFSIYISFREDDGGWSEPQQLGAKFDLDSNQPRISPDGKYIFFVSNDSMAYWFDARLIDEFRSNASGK